MSNLRTGTYGNYYGSYQGESSPITTAQMEVNALYVYSFLTNKGWTPEAIAGVLGNMENEGGLNPGRWENDDVTYTNGGCGLVGWTPARRHVDWCTERGWDWTTMDANLEHLNWEIHDGDDYYSTSGYPLSFEAFTQSKESPYYLACAFAWNYERSWVVLYGTDAEKEALRQLRGGDAEKWYTYLTGKEPIPPGPGGGGGGGGGVTPAAGKKGKYKFVLFGRHRRSNFT